MAYNFEVMAQAAKRWQDRRLTREIQLDNVNKGNISAVESSFRIQKRLDRLAKHASDPTVTVNPKTSSSLIENFALERIIGKDDLNSINVLETALAVSRFVGRVCICSSSGCVLGYGTGFMVSPSLLLTNNHVFPSAADAASSQVEFDYQLDRYGHQLPVHTFHLNPARFFLTNAELDFSLVAVQSASVDRVDLKYFSWIPLIGNLGKALIGDPLNIIQHPRGEPKQIAFRNNRLIDLFDQYAHYETDTREGSSGSPVFNDQWEVVALHHSGVPETKDGHYIAKDGSIWEPDMDPDRLSWIANEGIRISSLMERVGNENLAGERASLRDEMIKLAPPSPLEIAAQYAAAVENGAQLPPSAGSGEVVINIPLQVTVRLGNTVLAAAGSSQIQGTVVPRVTVTATPGPGQPPDQADPELQAALSELAEAETKVYYDEAADLAAGEVYYQNISSSLDPESFFDCLSELLRQTHSSQLAYKPAKQVYPWVDLHQTQNGLDIQSIYSGTSMNPQELIEADFRVEQERARLAEVQRSEAFFALMREEDRVGFLEAALPYNCEHVVPQSWFNKNEPMRGDLHHLFAVEGGCNSFRGNTPYYDFPDYEEVIRTGCGKREQGKFEPNNGKGPVSRAVLYFLLRYPGEINDNAKEYTQARLQTIKRWHMANPPTLYEKHRNQAIFEKQGNRNPFIDHPEWADRVDFKKGLGKP